MKRETILKTPRGLEIPLVPLPYCKYCTNPISEKWGRISGRCYFCDQRLKSLATEVDPATPFWDGTKPAKPTVVQPFAFGRAAAVGLYVPDHQDKGEFGRLVSAFKYRGQGGADLAEAMDIVLSSRFPEVKFDLLIPIPQEPENERNAPMILARALAARRNCGLINALTLSPDYKSDKSAPSEAKFNATRGHFRTHGESVFASKRLLLIDDVMTTGGHAHWAAEALRDRGASTVDVAVLARNFDLDSLRLIEYTGRF